MKGTTVIDDIDINFESVKEELAKLNCFKSMGPDAIHPKVLKSLSEDISFVDVELFRNCIDTGTIPSMWKMANVTALHKNGSKKEPLNYRPASLTCIICEVFEQIIRSNIVEFLNNSISDQQHGFVKDKSCLTNLLETMDCIISILESGAPVDLIYLDFSKAFDKVPHFRLLSKLENLGIKGKMLNVVKAFLTNIKFRVCISRRKVFNIK